MRNSRAELNLRVTWPTRTEVIQATQATLLFVLLTSIFLLLTDTIIGQLLRLLVRR
ncbi:MAG: preprotein translocase subunit SecE [Deinococcales bacterium]